MKNSELREGFQPQHPPSEHCDVLLQALAMGASWNVWQHPPLRFPSTSLSSRGFVRLRWLSHPETAVVIPTDVSRGTSLLLFPFGRVTIFLKFHTTHVRWQPNFAEKRVVRLGGVGMTWATYLYRKHPESSPEKTAEHFPKNLLSLQRRVRTCPSTLKQTHANMYLLSGTRNRSRHALFVLSKFQTS